MKTVKNKLGFTELHASAGKVIRLKKDGTVLSGKIILGKEDSADNYEEVEASEME